MKVAVLNYSGNVGKTTVARYLLLPRMAGAKRVDVETINADENQEDALKGKEFALLQEFLLSTDSAVVDIGASNIEDLLALMKRYQGSHEDFDFFVVPTVPAKKQQADTVATLIGLRRMGVPVEKLRLVFNQVDDGDAVEKAFGAVLAYAQEHGIPVDPAARIGTNELFQRLKGSDASVEDLATDPFDYKAAIAAAADPQERARLVDKLATRRLARGVAPELQACFDALQLK